MFVYQRVSANIRKDYRDESQHKDGSAINLDPETPTPTVFDSKIAGSVHHLSSLKEAPKSQEFRKVKPLRLGNGPFDVRC
jgi:hypothetical protein